MSYLAILAVVLVLLNTYPLLASQNLLFSSKRDSLNNQAAVMASALMELSFRRGGGVVNMLDSIGLSRVLVTDPSGLILYDSLAQPRTQRRTGGSQSDAHRRRNTATLCFRRWYWPWRATTWSTPPIRTAAFSPPPPVPHRLPRHDHRRHLPHRGGHNPGALC